MKSVQKSKKNNDEKNNKKWLLLLLLLLFICVFGFGVYYLGYNIGVSKKPVTPEPLPVTETYSIKISDKTGDWDKLENLNIFVVTSRQSVAPYDHGTYEFEIKNERSATLSYRIYLSEDNEDKVNIKYRLKNNGQYIIGQNGWVKYTSIDKSGIEISSGETQNYTLEWMWVSEDNAADTAIGLKPNRTQYGLTINVVASELEG